MNSGEIQKLLEEIGFSIQPGARPNQWWLGVAGDRAPYQLRLHLDDERLLLAYRFGRGAVRDDVTTLQTLLEANARLTVFKLALDESDVPVLLATWPPAHLTRDNLGFLLTQMVEEIDAMYDDLASLLR